MLHHYPWLSMIITRHQVAVKVRALLGSRASASDAGTGSRRILSWKHKAHWVKLEPNKADRSEFPHIWERKQRDMQKLSVHNYRSSWNNMEEHVEEHLEELNGGEWFSGSIFWYFLSIFVQVSLMVSQRRLGPRQGAGAVDVVDVLDVSQRPGSKDGWNMPSEMSWNVWKLTCKGIKYKTTAPVHCVARKDRQLSCHIVPSCWMFLV